jgi:hypothetical protein
MGHFSDYLLKQLSFEDMGKARKDLLREISTLRGNRDILVYASDLTKNAPISIDYNDILPFQDQLQNLPATNKSIDIILETPGGFAEIVEDLIKLIRNKYENVSVIVPGFAKSAGTIFAMGCDEILMGPASALGPIDAQMQVANKIFSAEAFLEGLEKIKKEITTTGKLNPAYIPILQNISPGEIQRCQNAQEFSEKLVKDWLCKYKFKAWNIHKSSGKPVTPQDKLHRAKEIANLLCKQSHWLTHGRSIKIEDFREMRLIINDFSTNPELFNAITKYYTLLRMGFDSTSLYKIYETIDSQIYKFSVGPDQRINQPAGKAIVEFECNICKFKSKIQINIGKTQKLDPGHIAYPVDDDIFECPNCKSKHNLQPMRMDIESKSKNKIVK